MNKLAVAGLVVVVLVIGMLAWVAWRSWSPLIQYQIDGIDARTKSVIQRYLDGSSEFEPTASELADLWRRKGELVSRLPQDLPAGTGSLTAIQLAVPDGATNDPRLEKLSDRAMELMMGPEAWARLQQIQRERGKRS